MSTIHVADTGLFVAMGGPENPKFQAVRAVARRNDITFVVPEAVYDELTAVEGAPEPPPIDEAIEDEWTRVAPPLAYEESLVADAMDGVRRHIANAEDRDADRIERADSCLAGVVAHAFLENRAAEALVYTTDVAAGRAIEAVFESHGYGDSVVFVDGFRFVRELLD